MNSGLSPGMGSSQDADPEKPGFEARQRAEWLNKGDKVCEFSCLVWGGWV